MSQPQVFLEGQSDPLASLLLDKEQLRQIFIDAEKTDDKKLMGIEYEVFALIDHAQRPLPFLGALSIQSLFKYLMQKTAANKDPWHPILEGPHIIALFANRAVIALEPGGQLEIAAKAHNSLAEVVNDFSSLVEELHSACTFLGIKLLALGFQPLAHRQDMADVQKSRYQIMWRYMASLKGLGLDMMTRSCAIQVNIDFRSEQDMVKKMRLAATLTPFLSALYSASPFKEGKPLERACERVFVWSKTDADRTGIPSIIYEDNFSYDAWIDYVLDVPMYFIRRDEHYIDMAGQSFRTFMKEGSSNGQRASLRDFVDHMSTVFTEVRLKPFIEFRSTDSLPLVYANALAVLLWMIFYHHKSFAKIVDLFANTTHEEVIALRAKVIDQGLKASFKGRSIKQVLIEIIEHCLNDIDEIYAEGKSYLISLLVLLNNDMSASDFAKSKFLSVDKNNINKLVDFFSPLSQPFLL